MTAFTVLSEMTAAAVTKNNPDAGDMRYPTDGR